MKVGGSSVGSPQAAEVSKVATASASIETAEVTQVAAAPAPTGALRVTKVAIAPAPTEAAKVTKVAVAPGLADVVGLTRQQVPNRRSVPRSAKRSSERASDIHRRLACPSRSQVPGLHGLRRASLFPVLTMVGHLSLGAPSMRTKVGYCPRAALADSGRPSRGSLFPLAKSTLL